MTRRVWGIACGECGRARGCAQRSATAACRHGRSAAAELTPIFTWRGAARQAGEFELALLRASVEAHHLAPGCLAQLRFSLASHCALVLTDVVVPAVPEPASHAALAFV